MTQVVVFAQDARAGAGLVSTARALAEETAAVEVHVVCLDAEAGAALARSGADSVTVLTGAESRPEAYTSPLVDVVRTRGADLLLVGATVSGWEIAARAATELGVGLVSEASSLRLDLSGPDGPAWHSERTVYAGGAVQAETWPGLGVVTVAPGRAAPATDTADPCPVETVAVEADTRIRVVGRTVREREGVDLASAARVVCVGMGLGSADGLPLVEDLADALGAEVACTRPVAEDREWLATERYLGISGVSVHPDLYVGLGVSGQVQHTVGFRDARVVVAVNINPDAPVFAVSDYAVVGDLREIAPLLAAAVRARA
ncbi:electron transfer flavoprotein subunit alpha [Actinomycetota bacterium]|nr:electron transfer flavoprotein subunit alpha [Actinomycetota bacterium]